MIYFHFSCSCNYYPMETIAFLSSMMFLGVFAVLFWFDRTRRHETPPAAKADDDRPASPQL
jgi:hypothetical protein